jgi:formylglycine-generating enzyme required for sulfatase activity
MKKAATMYLLAMLVVLCLVRPLPADVFHMPTGQTSLETVVVGDPGNQADDTGFGAVAYPYKFGKYEVTVAQYAEFLNARGKTEPDGSLWKNDMAEEFAIQLGCEIRREGEHGSYVYTVGPGSANRPINNVTFWDACRFCNWLHNGQGDGDTEAGAYTLSRELRLDARKVKRNPGAKWFLPNEDEWYKAAYYDPNKPGGPGYWDYPTRSDAKPGREFTSANAANFYDGGYLDPNRYFADVGAFAQARSAYGTLDQAGNIYEMTEGLVGPFLRCLWGGSYGSADGGLNRRAPNENFHSAIWLASVGFRVAGAVPGLPIETVSPRDSTSPEEPTTSSFPRRPWRDPETGKPFFPMGWFSGDAPGPFENTLSDLDDMASEGLVNAVIWYSAGDVDDDAMLRRNLDRAQRYLDHAHKRGIKVLVHLGGWHGAFLRDDAPEIARQRQWVEAVCTHPALLGYQLFDEPEYAARGGLEVEAQQELAALVEAFRKQRAAIRQWDPNPHRTVQVVFNLVPLSSWKAYLPVMDSFQIDRYPCGASMPYFGQQGDWGLLIMAWSMAHGAAALDEFPHLRNPAPCMQGVGLSHREGQTLGLWRDPLYEETRYMAYSSLTAGSWGVFHWIRNFVTQPNSTVLLRQVGRLHGELRQLLPALEQSYENSTITVSHNHEGITRDFLTDCISDISTLALEDEQNYYLIVADNSGVFEDVSLRMKLPKIKDTQTRDAQVLNEDWSREIQYDEATGEWAIATHTMVFGDVNIWMIPKAAP